MKLVPPTCIDLFCGCGGFTLGMQRAGFQVLAAVDHNTEAVATFRANLMLHRHPALIPVSHALQCDLTQYKPAELAKVIGTQRVDVIGGGPPCQGFSAARQVDGANHGARLKPDPRRHLYREFLCYVGFFQPRVFVIENVLGIRTAAGGEHFTRIQHEARALGRSDGQPGYRVHSQIEDAWELGAPQKRRRQLIVGVRNDLPGYFPSLLTPAPRAQPRICLGATICDLPRLGAGGGEDEQEYNLNRRARYFKTWGDAAVTYLQKVIEVDHATIITNHVARPHSDRDLRDFARLNEGENSATAIRDRRVDFEFPYKRHHFKDRYTRQSRREPCSTIVAHLSKDGLMFIHPTQNRSLTPREAARVQSFPDWFRFPSARTHAFRLIGNAVPPLIGEAVGLAVKTFLLEAGAHTVPSHHRSIENIDAVRRAEKKSSQASHASVAQKEAARMLERAAKLDRHALRTVPTAEFLRSWHALLFLLPGLHPDNALDHGDVIELSPTTRLALPGFEKLLARRYARSGWPVALELIGREAWRRYETHELSDDAFYCVEAQAGGLVGYAS